MTVETQTPSLYARIVRSNTMRKNKFNQLTDVEQRKLTENYDLKHKKKEDLAHKNFVATV